MSAPALPIWSSVGLVADREIRAKLRSKAFVLSGLFLLLAVLASIVIGSIAPQNPRGTKVAVVAGVSSVLDGVDGVDATPVGSTAEAEKLVRDESVSAAVVP